MVINNYSKQYHKAIQGPKTYLLYYYEKYISTVYIFLHFVLRRPDNLPRA